MAGQLLNIEIGDRLTKVCLSKPRGKTFEIHECFMFPTPENAVVDGQILQPEALAAALRAQLDAHKLPKLKSAVFALSSGKVATREVTLPPISDSKLGSVVSANAAEYFPIDLGKYHITYTLLERVSKGERAGCRVLVYAVPLELLESYFRTAELAGLAVQGIDYAGNSQYQALRALTGEDVTMYVNVDCKNSLVTFMKKDCLLMQRSLASGGDDVLVNYISLHGMGAERYVEALHACSKPARTPVAVVGADDGDSPDGLGRLVNGIARSNDYYNSNHWQEPVTEVVLMGPCCHLASLLELVAAATGLPTRFLDDQLGSVRLSDEYEKPSYYISCIGSSVAPLDFLPPQLVNKKKKKTEEDAAAKNAGSLLPGILICCLCALLTAALGFVAISGYNEAVAEKTAAEQQIAELSYTRDVYQTYLTYEQSAQTLLTLDAAIDSPNDTLNAFLTELEEKMPSEIVFLSAVCGRSDVSMVVTVDSFEAAAKTLVQLRSFESLSDIRNSDLLETEDAVGVRRVSFTLQCAYGLNPYLNNIYPYGPVEVYDDTAADATTAPAAADVLE